MRPVCRSALRSSAEEPQCWPRGFSRPRWPLAIAPTLWKVVWEDCRLATAERELLGVIREDDLPGSEAPAAWLIYLRGGSAVNLRCVLTHNCQGLKSLAGVLLHLAALSR